MLACTLLHFRLKRVHKSLPVPREKFDAVFGREVAAKHAVIRVITASVNGRGQNFVKADDFFRSRAKQSLFGTFSRVNVGVDNVFGVFENFTRVVRKNDFAITRFFIIIDIIHTGENMFYVAESLSEFLGGENVGIRIDAFFVNLLGSYETVPHLVGRVRKLNDEFFNALGNSFKNHRKTISRENRKNKPHGVIAEFFRYVFCNLIYRGIVSLRPRQNRLRNRDDVLILNFEAALLCRLRNAIRGYFHEVVAVSDDRRSHASRYCSLVIHMCFLLFVCRIL